MIIRYLKNAAHLLQAMAAVLCYGNPAGKLAVIGVTGTDGKTTTASLIYHILKHAGYKVALISTVAAYIGNEQIDTGFHVTTPDSWQLQRLLKRIVSQGYTHVVLEATSHGFDQHRLYGTHITTAVVTNITHEHLDYHGTYDRYLKAKSAIFREAKTAIINADDASFESLKKRIPAPCAIIPYGLENRRDGEWQPILDAAGKRFTEPYNRLNALAAALAASSVGVSEEDMAVAVPSFPGVPGRMQLVPNHHGITTIVDFAHTPNALKAALSAARLKTTGKLIAVFGAAGMRDKSKRPLMGKVAAGLADEVILTAEDPRSEDVRLIIDQIKSGVAQNRGHLHCIPDRRQAIRFGLKLAGNGDTVIVCGKGHERSMNLDGTHEIPWSDAKVVAEELRYLESGR